MGKQATIATNQIRENPVALRTVNRQSEEYQTLVDSIRAKGILNPPSVRQRADAETKAVYFELIDGLHRYTAAKDAGLVEIPVHILEFSDAEVLEAQIIGNLHSIKTPPSQYTKQIKRILTMNPLMTEFELAKRLGASPAFIQQRLSLTKIENKDILTLVDEGKIALSNAYALAKLPLKEQADYLDRAMTMKPDEFIPAVNQRIKEINEARRQGQAQGPAEFQPVAFLQKMAEIKKELDEGVIMKALIKRHKVKTSEEAFTMALRWTMHLDPESVDAQKVKYETRMKELEDAKVRKNAEKATKKQEEAEQKAKEAAAAAAAAQAALAGKKA
jgi:ParB family chromosome partitioning protein